MLISIQLMRGIAALLVVMVHAVDRSPGGSRWLESFGFGNFGVDLFFIISGFIMVETLHRQPMGPGTFLTRRIIRIVPLYVVATLGVALGLLLLDDGVRVGALIRSLLFMPYWTHPGDVKPFPILDVGWTLNLEMFFYGLIALGLFLRPPYRWAVPITGVVLLALMSLAGPWEGAIGNLYFRSIILEFAFGMGLGFLYQNRERLTPNSGTMFMLLGALLIISPLLDGTGRGIFWGLPALCFVAGALAHEGWCERSLTWLALPLGNSSYALYLSHSFSIKIMLLMMAPLGWPLKGDLLTLLLVMGSILGGLMTYHWVEQPLGRLIKKQQRPWRLSPKMAGEYYHS